MKVYILDDYDYDCEVRREDHDYVPPSEKLYEVPDDLVEEYEKINELRDVMKDKILLIRRQGNRSRLLNPINGIKPKGFD